MWLFFFFFFQAEDGIRDADVTGVQTCALPISFQYSCARMKVNCSPRSGPCRTMPQVRCTAQAAAASRIRLSRVAARSQRRSEERRVGKECRGRGRTEIRKER